MCSEGISTHNVNLSQTKRRFPAYTGSKGTQHTIFDKGKCNFGVLRLFGVEIKKAMEGPDPERYHICENQTKTTRYEQRSLGLDIKCNQKPIKLTPGPGEYVHIDANRTSTKNHGLKFGWPSNDSRLGSKAFQTHRTSDNTQTMLNSSQFGKFYQSPRDGMFSRKPGHYPQEPANFTLLTQEMPLQQPPMCTGKCLNLPDSLPPFKAPTKKFKDVESEYSIRNLNKTQRTEQPADSGFSTIQDSKVDE
jgi:hypothetical protein